MTPRAFFWILTAAAVVAAVVAGWIGLAALVRQPQLAPLGTVRIHGLVKLAAAEVLRQSGVKAGDNLILLDAAKVREALDRHPRIVCRAVEREFPGTLILRLEERRGAALVTDGARTLEIEENGRILGVDRTVLDWNLPVLRVTGPLTNEGRYANEEAIRFLGLLGQLRGREADLRNAVSEVRLEPETVVYLREGRTALHFGVRPDLNALRKARYAVAWADGKGLRPSLIDLRSETVRLTP